MVPGVNARHQFPVDARNIASASNADTLEVCISHSEKEALDASTKKRHVVLNNKLNYRQTTVRVVLVHLNLETRQPAKS
jgi:hypothetical protein